MARYTIEKCCKCATPFHRASGAREFCPECLTVIEELEVELSAATNKALQRFPHIMAALSMRTPTATPQKERRTAKR